MTRPLPYPGHSWSFTQHAVGFDSKTLYNFLKCAAPFEGEVEGYDEKITALMIASGVLTANQRDGAPDAWRDYQQLLAELGLIYSTKICRALTITELGQMFLAGEIGFSELIGIQALRLQYPNGQKSTIQSRLKAELESASIAYPQTLTELQANKGVLIKPGLLILRILIELQQAGHNPSLSVSECQAYLLPCRKNDEWDVALAELIANRHSPNNIDGINRHSRRNIQDWFKFLEKSDLFGDDLTGNISLSAYSLSNLDLIKDFCEKQEDASTYWIPSEFDISARLGWFRWFGHVPFATQNLLRSDLDSNAEYVEANFAAGMDDEAEDDAIIIDNLRLALSPVDLEHLGRDTPFVFSSDIEALADSLRKGAQKRHAKTLLHDRIIKFLAEKFIEQGARVEADADSIDLFAEWPGSGSAIFEIKTVTRRSLQGRVRTAVGQVEEYAYRRKSEGYELSDRVIVVNAEIESTAWQVSFLTNHMEIGLICKPSSSYSAFAPSTAQTKNHWLSLD